MLSIFYLEIISTTKFVTKKAEQDSAIGMKVNYVITAFYLMLFLLVILCQWAGEN
jgi:hypothetical protein